uniref:SET and MYND domain-containing protein 4 isoform X2 n=1 Tax=Rhizophora mucronata TaxID=61149 RepID=A0A2P2LMD0_RHIMU
MEKLKSAVPESLKRMVADSNPEGLSSTSSSLLDFLLTLPQFHQTLRDLVDPETALCGKNKDAALASKQKGNQCYSTGDYHTALACYTQALRVAPIDAADMDKNLVATLYLNRASLLQKVGLLAECLRDCTRALQISPDYAKAWYRRGKANAALGNYKDAFDDLNIAKNTELSLGGKRQIDNELKLLVDQHNCTSNTQIECTEEIMGNLDELHQNKLSCVSMPDKGRGMVSQCDIPQASLVHKEEPYTLVILKSCRETHCHHCLNELPADKVPCTACSIPLYCSHDCQVQAGGEKLYSHQKKVGSDKNHLSNPEVDDAKVMLCCDSDINVESIPEHRHECLGVNWPVALPTDVILAGRVMAKFISQQRGVMQSNLQRILDLSHNYSRITPESKLELHIYAIVLLWCLQHAFGFGLPANGIFLSQIVILICQIRVNSMAIFHMKSVDINGVEDQFGKFSSNRDISTYSVEQVKVGQAIYAAGSVFNHSCQPNIHAYFLSRTLFIRTSECVEAGSPMELSYGPQAFTNFLFTIDKIEGSSNSKIGFSFTGWSNGL